MREDVVYIYLQTYSYGSIQRCQCQMMTRLCGVTQGGNIQVLLSTNNRSVIRAVTVFAEGIFEGETLVMHPRSDQVQSSLTVPLAPPKDTALDIHIRVLLLYIT